MGGINDKTGLKSIAKEEVWAVEDQAEQICNELLDIYEPFFRKHNYQLILNVFRIDFNLSTKKGIIKNLTRDDIFEIGYYSGIDVSVTDSDGNLAERHEGLITRNITLWGYYKSFFRKRYVINQTPREELQALLGSIIEENASLLNIDLGNQ